MIISCLHAKAVNEFFEGHFVVGLQDIVTILDCVIVVAYRVILNDVIKLDHSVVFAVEERLVLYVGAKSLLSTSSILACQIPPYPFSRFLLK